MKIGLRFSLLNRDYENILSILEDILMVLNLEGFMFVR